MKFKHYLSVFLLVFVVSATGTFIARIFSPVEPIPIPNGSILVFCHARIRCPTCEKMEILINRTLDKFRKHAKIQLLSLEYDAPENADFANRFHVGTAAIILIDKREGQIVKSRDLTVQVWEVIGSDTAFCTMLEHEIRETFVL